MGSERATESRGKMVEEVKRGVQGGKEVVGLSEIKECEDYFRE